MDWEQSGREVERRAKAKSNEVKPIEEDSGHCTRCDKMEEREFGNGRKVRRDKTRQDEEAQPEA